MRWRARACGCWPPRPPAAAKAAGIDSNGVIAGHELASGKSIAQDVNIFARITPEQKLALVRQFRASDQVVAMTGDGINDAPALAAADIGIAMGVRGTDVAREASDLILLDDRFASIIGGIGLGRRIFVNLRRALTYVTAIHVPIAGLALLPILLGLPPMLYPMHLVLLELILDPLCALVFEAEPSDPNSMKRPPRRASEPLFGRRQLLLAGIQGAILLAAVFTLYFALISAGDDELVARTSAFIALVSGHLSLAAAGSGQILPLLHSSRLVFWIIAGGALTIVALSLTVPVLTEILKFAPLDPAALLGSTGVGLIAGGWHGLWQRVSVGEWRRRS